MAKSGHPGGGDDWLGSARRFSLALRAARAGAWEWDIATGAARWSPENYALMGLAPGDGEAKYDLWLERVHPEDRERAQAEVERAIEEKGELDFEYRTVWPDGTVRWLRDVGTMVFDDRGKPIGMFGIQIDVTQNHALEEELRHFQKMEALGRVAGAVAHDFNNLLTVIRGYSELLQEQLGPEEEPREMADEIVRAADRAAELTRQLLAFGRRQVLRSDSLDLNELIERREELLRQTLGENVALITRLGPRVGPVWADESQIELVLLNLAVNAADAMPTGGSLTIRTEEVDAEEVAGAEGAAQPAPGRYVALSVEDTGTGMDAETRERLFEPYFTTKPPEKGSGLGLASVYGIVKQSGGEIAVESELQKGSRFTIFLPRG